MGTPEGEKRIPEWSVFDRLDELEKITLEQMEKTDTIEPTLKEVSRLLKDAIILATYALYFNFTITSKDRDARKLKDGYISILKNTGLSKSSLESVHESLITLCEAIEKKQK